MKRMRERYVYVPNRKDPFNFESTGSGEILITLPKPLENGDEVEILGSEKESGFDGLCFKATYLKIPYDEISFESTLFVQYFRYNVNGGAFDASRMRVLDVIANYYPSQNGKPSIELNALPTKQEDQVGFDPNLQGHAAIVITKSGLEDFKGHAI